LILEPRPCSCKIIQSRGKKNQQHIETILSVSVTIHVVEETNNIIQHQIGAIYKCWYCGEFAKRDAI